MLVDEVHSAFLRCRAFALAVLDEAPVLEFPPQPAMQGQRFRPDKKVRWFRLREWKWKSSYRLLASFPSRSDDGVMVLFDVKIQETIRGEILPTLGAAVDM